MTEGVLAKTISAPCYARSQMQGRSCGSNLMRHLTDSWQQANTLATLTKELASCSHCAVVVTLQGSLSRRYSLLDKAHKLSKIVGVPCWLPQDLD